MYLFKVTNDDVKMLKKPLRHWMLFWRDNTEINARPRRKLTGLREIIESKRRIQSYILNSCKRHFFLFNLDFAKITLQDIYFLSFILNYWYYYFFSNVKQHALSNWHRVIAYYLVNQVCRNLVKPQRINRLTSSLDVHSDYFHFPLTMTRWPGELSPSSHRVFHFNTHHITFLLPSWNFQWIIFRGKDTWIFSFCYTI